MVILLLTLAVFAIVMLIMSVGVLFSGRCLRGSCGGPEVLDASGDPVSCAACPRRKEREARKAQGGLPVVRG